MWASGLGDNVIRGNAVKPYFPVNFINKKKDGFHLHLSVSSVSVLNFLNSPLPINAHSTGQFQQLNEMKYINLSALGHI